MKRLIALLTMVGVLASGGAAFASDSVGVVDKTQGFWYLRNPQSGATTSFFFGNPGDYPILGDWDCDGVDTPGMYRQTDGYVYLRNSNSQGVANIRFFFGIPGDIPLAGDFDGDGCDSVSIYRPSEAKFYIINKLGANEGGLGAADFAFVFGNPGDKPFVGDFDGDGVDEIGLHRESTGFVYYRNTLSTGNAHNSFFYGDPNDQIITGDWAQNPKDGTETVGIFRPSNGNFYLRFNNSQGNADVSFQYGNAQMTAVAGTLGSLPGGGTAPVAAPQPPKVLTLAQQNAIKKAQSYLKFMSFSRLGLIGQLEYEKFSNADATFAVDYLNVDWNAQAYDKGLSYLKFMSFSRQGLIDQLLYEKFTAAQATYAVDKIGL